MKKNVLLSSILTIALCLSLVAGSTFALFTDASSSEIAVKAGDVTMDANLDNLNLFSAVADPNGEEFDENGKTYYYAPQATQFSNGGTATITDDLITLTNITPGDKITFELEGKNTSNVAIQYRYRIEVIEGFDLMSGCIFTVEGTKYPAMASYDSKWAYLDVNKNVEDNDVIELALELPISAGNYFQNLDAKIKLTVEAVQANADMSDTNMISVKYITSVNDTTELASKLTSNEYLHIFLNSDLNETLEVSEALVNKTIDADGHNLSIKLTGALENVVITNVKDTEDETPAIIVTGSTTGDITVKNSKLYSGAKIPYGALAGSGSSTSLDVTLENCVLTSGGDKYGLYLTNSNNVTVRDCTFNGFGSWAIIVNGTTAGNITISGCTFENCAGILKTSIKGKDDWQTGSLNGNFTFANNTMVNCTMKDGTYMQIKNLAGTITFSNNTLDGVVVTAEDMKGIDLP